MMNRLPKLCAMLVVSGWAFVGCSLLPPSLQPGPRTPVLPPYGGPWGFNQTTFPVDVNYEQNSIGDKIGSSSSTNILWLFAFGNASIREAARKGGITRVDHVDAKALNILGVYSEYEIIVYGE